MNEDRIGGQQFDDEANARCNEGNGNESIGLGELIYDERCPTQKCEQNYTSKLFLQSG